MGISYCLRKIEPAPFIQFQKQYNTSSDGTVVGSTFSLTLEGTILPDRGSPTSSGTFWIASGSPPIESTLTTDEYFQSILRKQEALRQLFSVEGSGFRIDGFDGYNYMCCNPRIKGIKFPAGNPTSWAYKCPYTVELEADSIYLYDSTHTGIQLIEDSGNVNNYKIETAEENWNVEANDENLPLFRLTHNLSAKGKRFYSPSGTLDKQAWQNARDWVTGHQGYNNDRAYVSGVLNLVGYSGYNYLRTQTQGDLAGTFGVTETWLLFAPTVSGYHAHDDSDINVRVDEAGLTNVTVQGKIQGLQTRNNYTYGPVQSQKFENASGYYWQTVVPNLLARAQNIAGLTLHPTPVGITVGHNQLTGVISYNYDYNNRPTATISGARSEKISVSFQYPKDIYSNLTVLGRAAGPIMQNISTRTSSTKTVTIELVMGAKTQSFTPTMPDVNSLISGYVPVGPTQIFVANNGPEQWDANSGRFSRSMTWEYSS